MLKKNSLSFILSLQILSILFTPNLNNTAFAQNSQHNVSNQTNKNVEALNPRDYNVLIVSDDRILLTMAALTLAGYKYEGTGKLADLQLKLKEDLKNTSPELVKKLQNFYNAHRIENREEVAQISPYIGLALSLSAVPGLNNPPIKANLPFDVQEVLGFSDLLREFYSRSPIRNFLPTYKNILDSLRTEYENVASSVLYETLVYLRTKPIIELRPTPVLSKEYDTYVLPNPVEVKKDKNKENKEITEEKGKEKIKYLPRVRRLQIFPNPFAPAGTVLSRNDVLNGADNESRRLGDDYFIIVSEQSVKEHIRHAFLRFVLDPVVGKKSVEIAELKEKIDPLITALPNPKERAKRNVFEAVGESLARAVGIRLTARTEGNVNSDEAIAQLSQYYEQGFVLVFHFYEGLAGLERSGVDVNDFFPALLTNIDFAHEAKRLDETKEARVRAQEKRASSKAAVVAAVKPIIEIDALIKQRKYVEAKTQLEVILREQPNNARALFGMAQIVNNQPSKIELDDINSDDDKIAAQEERLAGAVKLYRQAISVANPEEKWLISQCYVLIGRIYDFAQEREAAIKEYDKAIQLGDIPQGGYKEAIEGKSKPYIPTNRNN